MVGVKDKVVTVESLSALHEHNKATFETKENVKNLGQNITGLLNDKFDKPENNIVPMSKGGTSSSNGADGLANLFASGATILSSFQYGDTLPSAGTKGRIFFKRVIE